MKNYGKKTWLVNYDWIETKWGPRPNWIREFKTEPEARKFAETETTDGVVTWMQEIKN